MRGAPEQYGVLPRGYRLSQRDHAALGPWPRPLAAIPKPDSPQPEHLYPQVLAVWDSPPVTGRKQVRGDSVSVITAPRAKQMLGGLSWV